MTDRNARFQPATVAPTTLTGRHPPAPPGRECRRTMTWDLRAIGCQLEPEDTFMALTRVRFWSLALVLVALLAILPFGSESLATETSCISLKSNSYYILYDKGKGKRTRNYLCFYIQDHHDLQGVVTLKHYEKNSDWNFFIAKKYNNATGKSVGRLAYNNNSGSTDEITMLPKKDSAFYQLIVWPNSTQPSRSCVIFHRFAPGDVLAKALGTATFAYILGQLFGNETDSAEQRRNKSRVIAGGMSILQERNLGRVGRDVILNEISIALSEAFGGGSWFFDFGLSYFSGYLDEYGRYLFRGPEVCAN